MKTFRVGLAVVLGMFVIGCSGTTDPASKLSIGTYSYSASVPFFKSDGSLGTSTFAGTLTLTYVSADSIAGTFQANNLKPATALGFKNQDAYLLYAYTTPWVDVVAHRIRPDLGCTAKYVGNDPTGTCTLTRQ